jgi:hypothetical protein
MNDIYTALQNSVDFGHIPFYQANYKDQFATSISEYNEYVKSNG